MTLKSSGHLEENETTGRGLMVTVSVVNRMMGESGEASWSFKHDGRLLPFTDNADVKVEPASVAFKS